MPRRNAVRLLSAGLLAMSAMTLAGAAHAADAVAVTDDQPAADDKPDAGTPLISIEGEAEMQLDSSFGKPRTTAIYATVEPEITVNLSDTFRLFGHFIYEPVNDPIEGRFNTFHDEGLYAEELYAGLTLGNVQFSAGKINPVFGIATDEAPGLYGRDFAEGYDFKGALGLNADIFLSDNTTGSGDDAETVKQIIHASVFTADPTVLSRSLITDRGLYDWRDYRVGNTDLPESFALAYEYTTKNADDEVVGPTWRIAVRRLAARQGNMPDEWGFLAAGQTAFDLGDERTLRPIAEMAYFVNEGGYSKNAAAGTIGLEFQQGDWIASLTAAAHDTFGGSTPVDYNLTGSIGRIFKTEATGEFRVDAGYSNARVDGATTNVIGLRLHKDFSWESDSRL